MARPPRRSSLALAACAALLATCGAKTGLRLPDATVDAPEDVFVRFDACVAGRFQMVRRSAEILFVIDRSGSMAEPLVATDPTMTTRWQAMKLALGRTLSLFDRDVDMGALVYPRVPEGGPLGNLQYCDLSPAGVDVAPAPSNGPAVLRALDRSGPQGATPTGAALRRATSFLQAREARGRGRYVVLATDGVPNCNRALDAATCTCLGAPSVCQAGPRGVENCLDDTGSVAAIEDARRGGIATYVVGIDGDLEARFTAVLDRMAVAGGRARPAAPRYYSIRDFDQLVAAFEGIQRTVVRCSFVTPSRPDDPDAIAVAQGGAAIPRDPARRDGWDWTDRDYGELTVFGPACDRVLASGAALTATVACADR